MNGRRSWFGVLLFVLLLTYLACGEVGGIASALGHSRGESFHQVYSRITWTLLVYCYRQSSALISALTHSCRF